MNRIIIFITSIFIIFGLTFYFLKPFAKADENTAATSTPSTAIEPRQKPAKTIAKGVYLTASSAANPKKVTEIIKLLDATELNAVVIDIKDFSGKILYASEVPLAMELKTTQPVIKNVSDIIKQFHDHDIYVIARQTVFQDPLLAAAKPAWAIKVKSGALWRDNLGLPWVDPSKHEVWDYNIDIAKEAISLGFDEINFDYVRFPSDGNLKSAVYAVTTTKKFDVMRDFYVYLGAALSSEPAWISVDFFGLVMELRDGLGIGQRIVDAADVVDYISPMMYPSHYAKGYLGFANPAAYPGPIIANGMKRGIGLFKGQRALVRPWLQAFHIGAYYDGTKIRAQIDAVEKYPNGGWLLWNPSNRYSSAGLKKG